ncbi:MAG: M48 family metallopeptidase [Defluviitaleaceae bacterium]|nr:M48 family metallopeptidase [Defluviitaleaceae bacterium]
MVEISGIKIEIHKKKIKNLHLYVKPPNGKVTVSAPLAMSTKLIEQFLQTKIHWIKKQVAKFENQPLPPSHQYILGETLYIWGKQYFLQIEYGKKNLLTLLENTAILTVRKESTPQQHEQFVREWYRKQLKAEISKILPKWEKITGLKSSGWQTKHMTTRWGTCNTNTGKIWLNLQLAKKPQKCLEYVVLHELCHLAERKHNEKFVGLMDKHMPAWREVRNELNGQPAKIPCVSTP